MRVGLSWELDPGLPLAEQWPALLAEACAADRMGFDSIWIDESWGGSGAGTACSPTIMLSYLARRTKTVRLCAIRRPPAVAVVRMAEELAVLDQFSRGRAGIAFAGDQESGWRERVEFTLAAMRPGAFRYRGDDFTFPAGLEDPVPNGFSRPSPEGTYTPQWEMGPAVPEFLAVTPKPFASQVPAWIEGGDADSLAAPLMRAACSETEAIEVVSGYLEQGGQGEPAIERWIEFGPGDSPAGGGAPVIAGKAEDLVIRLRDLAAATGAQHLVWHRRPDAKQGVTDLLRFASEIQPMLQA